MIICSNCGAELQDNSKFCGVCGATVNSAGNAPQGGFTAPVPPVQGGNPAQFQGAQIPPFQGAPVPPFQGGDGFQPQGVQNAQFNGGDTLPLRGAQGQPYNGAADRVQLDKAGQGAPNEYPADVTLRISDAAAQRNAQSGGFQAPPAGGSMQFINNNGMPGNNTMPINNGNPGNQNIFSNGQPVNYGMPMGGYNEPAPMNYTQPAPRRPRKPLKKMQVTVSIVLAIVFGLFSFVFGIYSMAGGAIRTGLKSSELSDSLGKIEVGKIVVGDILAKDSMKSVVRKNGIVLPDRNPEKATLAKVVALTVNKNMNREILTEDKVNEILKRADVNEELSNLAKAYEDYILTGVYDGFEEGLCEEIKKVVRTSESDVILITGMKLTDDYGYELDKALDSGKNSVENILPDEALHSVSGLLKIFLSPVALIAGLVLAIFLVALEFIVTKRLTAAMITGGVVFTLLGAIYTAGSIVLSNLSMIPALDYTVVRKVLSPLVYNTFGAKMLIFGLISLFVGILLIVLFIVFKALEKKRQNLAATEND